MTEHDSPDSTYMARCLELARNAAGRVSPNPMVGCVIVDVDGAVIGEGRHERYGGPHAERNAISDAVGRGHEARLPRSTLYVNLEPCNHHGSTPPCTDIILETGIPRVVVGTPDSNPVVDGSGIRRLRDAGVDVRTGVMAEACYRLNEAFFVHIRTGRPLVTLKLAQTLDAQIATQSGDSKWISGIESRTIVHRWRAEMDAVLVGRGTALADDPSLTVRHVDGGQPYRIVLDRRGSLPATLNLFSDSLASKTIAVLGREATQPDYARLLRNAGGHVMHAPVKEGHLDLATVLEMLGRGDNGIPVIQSILVEAGSTLATAHLRQDVVDRLFIFISPRLIGSGLPAVGSLGIDRVSDAIEFADVEWTPVGADLLFQGYLRPSKIARPA